MSLEEKRFGNPHEQAAYEQGIKHGEPLGRFLGLAIRKDLENQQLTEDNREQKRQATHDALTGLLNRRGLVEYLSNSDITNHAILYADGTNIKKINDTLGHEAGDQAIVGIADVLRGALRKVDIIARIGGDEFLAVLAPISRNGKLMPVEQQVELIGERISERTESLKNENPDFTTSGFDIAIGLAVGHPGLSIAELQVSAEERMVEHKAAQHNQVGAYR